MISCDAEEEDPSVFALLQQVPSASLVVNRQVPLVAESSVFSLATDGLGGVENQNDFDRLLQTKLNASYEKFSRPIPDCSIFDCTHKIRMKMSLSFKKLMKLDQVTSTLSMLVWRRITWPDFRLAFNASEYFGHTPAFQEDGNFTWDSEHDFVPLDQHLIWTPDVQLLNAVHVPDNLNDAPRVFWYDEQKLRTEGYNLAMVVPQRLDVDCPMDLRMFPFDTQTCSIQMGDWSASERYYEFDPEFSEDGTEMPEASKEHECIGINITQQLDVYHVKDRVHFPMLVYTLTLRRFPHYHFMHFVLPQFILVLIGQGVFWMDLQGERHSTAVTAVLAVMTVSFLMAPLLPETNEVMWLERFQVGCYILSCMPIFTSFLLAHAQNKGFGKVTDRIDAILRVAYPVLVLIFYVCLFHGVPIPMDQPEIIVFFGFNLFVFFSFLATGIVGLRHEERVEEALDGDSAASSK